MNRRSFLTSLLASTAALAIAPTLDLDKLLWVPGERTIFLPPAGAQYLTMDMLVARSLKMLKNNLVWSSIYADQFFKSVPDVAVGEAIRAAKPLVGFA